MMNNYLKKAREEHIRDLIRKGLRIDAIRYHRTHFKSNLAEAREYVWNMADEMEEETDG